MNFCYISLLPTLRLRTWTNDEFHYSAPRSYLPYPPALINYGLANDLDGTLCNH